MTSIALGVFIILIIYVMVWSIRNDDARSIRDQTGLIRMRVPAAGPGGRAKRAATMRTTAAAPSRAPGPLQGQAHSAGSAANDTPPAAPRGARRRRH